MTGEWVLPGGNQGDLQEVKLDQYHRDFKMFSINNGIYPVYINTNRIKNREKYPSFYAEKRIYCNEAIRKYSFITALNSRARSLYFSLHSPHSHIRSSTHIHLPGIYCLYIFRPNPGKYRPCQIINFPSGRRS